MADCGRAVFGLPPSPVILENSVFFSARGVKGENRLYLVALPGPGLNP